MFENLPILTLLESFLNKKKKNVSTVVFNDIFNSKNKAKALEILNDPFAEEELERILKLNFNYVQKIELIDFRPEKILSAFN